ncbi:MAG: hypothetical protein OEY01_07595 [Desulfobulbaceae bacterium]|nr:hypothetical protein [Desulfobulbaceae bacterium]HIJ78917.1 hypothetical protein [Deltaproteobacteria bacterium]
MDEKKTKLTQDIEDTMACSAFGEAGEPCPISSDEKKDTRKASQGEKKVTSNSVEGTMACSAFAEAGEPCPINSEKETNKKK